MDKETKKQEKERKAVDIFWDKPLDKETILKLVKIVLNSKSKGHMIFITIWLLIIFSLILLLIHFILNY
jgi:hypothetical protein